MEHTKLTVRGQESNSFYAVVDEETNGKKFYEEIQTIERAKCFVKYWNSQPDLLEACKNVADLAYMCAKGSIGTPKKAETIRDHKEAWQHAKHTLKAAIAKTKE